MLAVLPGLHHAIEKIGCERHVWPIHTETFGLRFPIVYLEPIPELGRVRQTLATPEL